MNYVTDLEETNGSFKTKDLWKIFKEPMDIVRPRTQEISLENQWIMRGKGLMKNIMIQMNHVK